MLVLSRKSDESIHIGCDIVVKVLRIGRGRVAIGIEAPREVSILRGELPPNLHVVRTFSTPCLGHEQTPGVSVEADTSHPRTSRTDPRRLDSNSDATKERP